jgi:hypothetical protein
MNFGLQRKCIAKENSVTQNAQKCSTLKTANVWCSPLSFSPLLYSQCLWLSISLAYNIHPGFSAIFDNRSFDTNSTNLSVFGFLYKFFTNFLIIFFQVFSNFSYHLNIKHNIIIRFIYCWKTYLFREEKECNFKITND